MANLLIPILILFVFSGINAQNNFTSAKERAASVEEFDSRHSDIAHLKFENIGPTIFSGRVTDVTVNPQDASHFYVAYASGGLWETVNSGTTFTPIFDNEAIMTIGDIAVNWKTNEIWVGTGEVNSSRSSYAGLGVYKSKDNGKNWTHLGLEESHHIGRIVLHPTDPNVAWVGVLGHLYTSNPERGVYKTIDGGTTWSQVLTINNETGIVDVIIDPKDPNTLYAAAWQRDRKAWNFVESGSGSGIYKSTNGGDIWIKVSGGNSGFPSGEGVGRVGLSITSTDSATSIYALLDNYDRRPPKVKEPQEELTKEDFRNMSKDVFMKIENKEIDKYLKSNRFPEKYTAKVVRNMIENDEVKPNDLATYLENANALLFDTPVIGAELYVSEDGGKSWTKTHEDFLDGLYYSYGYYFGVISVNPKNENQVFIAGVPILRSDDGGKTFKNVNGQNVHVDHHSIWINPENPRHIINGNDGGVNISYDSGDNWIKCNSPSVGQFYYINVDQAEPYNVYGGTQDNGVWKGSNNYRPGVRWHNTGRYPYKSLLGGDGMQVQIDPRDNNTVYTGLQFGNYYKVNATTGKRKFITPRHVLGQRPYRWNWQTPIHLSMHNPDILYMGAHKLFRSMNQGEDFIAISEDLTMGGKEGDVPYGTLSAIHESPLRFGLIYTGSDDGLVHVSKDGGFTWENISSSLPSGLWVSRIQASTHDEVTVYVSLNGYRNDDFASYIYESTNHGQSWNRIGLDLPAEPVNVIKEDPNIKGLLYVGTDRGVYISMDNGVTFSRTFEHIPNVPIHDIVVQKGAKDLIIGTHGRSIYKGDLEAVYAITKEKQELMVMDIPAIKYNNNLGNRRNSFSDYAKNEQDIIIYSEKDGMARLTISTEDGSIIVMQKEIGLSKGLNYENYDLSISTDQLSKYKVSLKEDEKIKKADNNQYYLLAGTYKVSVSKDGLESSINFEIRAQ